MMETNDIIVYAVSAIALIAVTIVYIQLDKVMDDCNKNYEEYIEQNCICTGGNQDANSNYQNQNPTGQSGANSQTNAIIYNRPAHQEG